MIKLLPKEKYREVLRVSLPLVAAMASATVMQFTDRVFLANYSLDAIAAALPAGITAHLFITIFDGTAGYLNVLLHSIPARPLLIVSVPPYGRVSTSLPLLHL